jgi:hypothetical protein
VDAPLTSCTRIRICTYVYVDHLHTHTCIHTRSATDPVAVVAILKELGYVRSSYETYHLPTAYIRLKPKRFVCPCTLITCTASPKASPSSSRASRFSTTARPSCYSGKPASLPPSPPPFHYPHHHHHPIHPPIPRTPLPPTPAHPINITASSPSWSSRRARARPLGSRRWSARSPSPWACPPSASWWAPPHPTYVRSCARTRRCGACACRGLPACLPACLPCPSVLPIPPTLPTPRVQQVLGFIINDPASGVCVCVCVCMNVCPTTSSHPTAPPPTPTTTNQPTNQPTNETEITATVLCGYGAYLLAEVAEASGVLSMVSK